MNPPKTPRDQGATVMEKVRTRPADRRQRIIATATDLFATRGYDHVAMSDIAAAVGIVPSALYRHFPGRQDLMREVILSGLEPARRLVDENRGSDIDRMVREFVELTDAQRALGVLWRRESRHLDGSDRERLRHEIHAVGDHVAEAALAARPDLSPDAAEVLAWCTLGVMFSASGPHLELQRPNNPELLTALCVGILNSTVEICPPPDRSTVQLAPFTRRELVLREAVRLFAREGYTHVGIEDIGASVGIAGPSIYNHFASKGEILQTALTRTSAHLRLGVAGAYAEASSASDALDLIMRVYLSFGLRHPDLVTLLVTEVGHLDESPRAEVIDTVRDLVDEMANLLQADHPTVNRTDATVRVYATLTMISDVARTATLRRTANLEGPLHHLGRSLLMLDQSSDV